MPDFNLVPLIGGVDTSDPSRMFSPEEQKKVLDHIFGSSGRLGRLVLPNSERLYVGRRKSSDKYSIGRETGDGLERPALFVPRVGEKAILAVQDGNVREINGLFTFNGFLPVSVGKLLSLGKHVMQEEVEGKRVSFKSKSSPEHARARDYLTQCIIVGALTPPDPTEDGDGDDLETLNIGIGEFLGEDLAKLEKRDITDGQGGAFEEYTIELMRRVCLVSTTRVE